MIQRGWAQLIGPQGGQQARAFSPVAPRSRPSEGAPIGAHWPGQVQAASNTGKAATVDLCACPAPLGYKEAGPSSLGHRAASKGVLSVRSDREVGLPKGRRSGPIGQGKCRQLATQGRPPLLTSVPAQHLCDTKRLGPAHWATGQPASTCFQSGRSKKSAFRRGADRGPLARASAGS